MKAISVKLAINLLSRREELQGRILDLSNREFAATLVLTDQESGEEIGVIDDDGLLNECRDSIIARSEAAIAAIDGELMQLGVTDLDALDVVATARANDSYYGPGGAIDEALGEGG